MEIGHATARRMRRWCIPAAMQRDPADTLEGDGILVESPNDLGLLLWHAVRDGALWGQADSAARRNLFAPGSADLRAARLAVASVPKKIEASIHTLHGMLALGDRASAGDLCVSCLEIAAWASGAGLARTAVAFAQAAALAEPSFGAAALQTGICATAAGQHARGETWLRRAIGLARRERDRACLTAAAVELAVLAVAQGKLARAERWYIRAARAARRFRLPDVRVRALHGLFRLALQRNRRDSAIRYARVAHALQRAAVARPEMLLDLALFWRLIGDGRREQVAVRRVQMLWESLSPAPQLRTAAMVARARADPNASRRGAKAARIAWGAMDAADVPDEVRVPAAMDLAHAAARTGNHAAFTQAKRIVLRLAPASDFLRMMSELDALWPHAPARERSS